MNIILTHWKTTLMGTLVLVIASSSAIHFDASGHLATSAKDWFTVGIGVFVQGLAMLQKDGDKITTPDIVKANQAAGVTPKP